MDRADATTVTRVQRRTVAVLAAGSVLGGVGVAVPLGFSSLVATRLSGSATVGGAASTAIVLGAAATAAVLGRVAQRSGRRPALVGGYLVATVGALGAVVGTSLGSAALVLVALLAVGAGTAVGLAARYAATDLAEPGRAGRSLAMVVWATTVGAVAGPNLLGPLQSLAGTFGLVPDTGPYLLSVVAFLLGVGVTALGLRPDPLRLARERAGRVVDDAPPDRREVRAALTGSPRALLGAGGIVLGHAVMVGLMAMTPVHMDAGGTTLTVVGLVISLHIAGMYALSPLFGWLGDRVGPGRVLLLAAVLLVAAGLVCGLAAPTATTVLTVGLVLLGLGWSGALIGGSAMLSAALPLPLRARGQATVDVAMNLAGAVAGVGAGLLVATTSYAVLGLVAAALAVPFLVAVVRRPVRAPAG